MAIPGSTTDTLMTMSRHLRICAGLIVLFGLLASGQETHAPAGISKAAQQYLDHVLDLMQAHALHTREIDWAAVRSETLKRAAGAETTSDTYPAIYYALTRLKERHSFLRLPDALSEAERKRAFASMRAILAPYKDQSLRHASPVFRGRTAPSGHMIHVGNASFAYVVIPACVGKHSDMQGNLADFHAYAESLHSIAADLEANHPLGWIVDLRGNGGGSMYPMIAGIGFLLGEGTLGYFVSSDGSENAWFYRKGKAGMMSGSSEETMEQIKDASVAARDLPPVAVLLDSGTASAAEAVAISFIDRPSTRSFGAHTFGLSTGNRDFPLADGTLLILCGVVEADRKHREYPDGIEPDVAVPEPAVLPSAETDTAIQQAEQWLLSLRAE